MLIRKIAGCTHDIGKDQGYLNLPIRVTPGIISVGGLDKHVVLVESAWEPNPEELAKLNDGGSVIVQLVNALPHPPIQVYVDSEATLPANTIQSLALEIKDLAKQIMEMASNRRDSRGSDGRTLATDIVDSSAFTRGNEIFLIAKLIAEFEQS